MTAAKLIPELSANDLARFDSKVERGAANDCWLWRGGVRGDGYGAFWLAGSTRIAHRVAVRAAGYSVPTDAVIDHICRNRLCVNPRHLRTVDHFTNVHENSEAPAHLNSLKQACPQGHPYSGANLIVRKGGRRGCRECRNEYQRNRRSGASAPAGPVGNADAPTPSPTQDTNHND